LSADAVGSSLSWTGGGFYSSGDRRGAERGDPLAQPGADPLLVAPAGTGHA